MCIYVSIYTCICIYIHILASRSAMNQPILVRCTAALDGGSDSRIRCTECSICVCYVASSDIDVCT